MITFTRERIVLIFCVVLVAVTSTALVANRRLQRRQGQLEVELAALRPLALAVAKAQKPSSQKGMHSPASPSATKSARTGRRQPPPDIEAERKAFETEIQTLRGQLSAPSPTNLLADADGNRGRRGREEAMEQLKLTDPQRYQEIETQRAAFQERLKTETQDKQSFLESVDISHWPADMQANHVKIMDLYARMADAAARTVEGAASDRDAQRRLFSQWRETRDLLQAEQEMLLFDTARQLGFEGGNADQFVEYIKTINQVTSPGGLFHGRGRPPNGHN
ncbi:MAG: hypothetical protein R6X19_05865 [Kiritimatiellia bacterium]